MKARAFLLSIPAIFLVGCLGEKNASSNSEAESNQAVVSAKTVSPVPPILEPIDCSVNKIVSIENGVATVRQTLSDSVRNTGANVEVWVFGLAIDEGIRISDKESFKLISPCGTQITSATVFKSNNVLIEGFKVDLQGEDRDGINISGVKDTGYNIEVRNVVIQNTVGDKSGIRISADVKSVTIDNVTVENAYIGIQIKGKDTEDRQITISNSEVINNRVDGIRVLEGVPLVLESNLIENNVEYGINKQGNFKKLSDEGLVQEGSLILMTNNTVINNGGSDDSNSSADLSNYAVILDGTDSSNATTSGVESGPGGGGQADEYVLNVPPVAEFEYLFLQDSNLRVVSLDQAGLSFDSDGQIVRSVWSFSDGNSIEVFDQETLNYEFSADGSYDVMLTVYDDQGDSASITRSIIVDSFNQAPMAMLDIIPSNFVSVGDTVPVYLTRSYDPDGTIESYEIRVIDPDGNVTFYPGSTVNLIPNVAGTWRVEATIIDNRGRPGYATMYMNVDDTMAPNPVIYAQRVGPLTMKFDMYDSTVADGRQVTNWHWIVEGDPSLYFGDEFEYFFNDYGFYRIFLVFYDDQGGIGVAIYEVQLSEDDPMGPTISFIGNTISSIGPPIDIYYFAGVIEGDAPISQYEWKLGDGSLRSGAAISHQYSGGLGFHQIIHEVTDANGMRARRLRFYDFSELYAPEIVLAGELTGTAPFTTTLDASGTTIQGDEGIASFAWDLTDDGVYNPTFQLGPVQELSITEPGTYNYSVQAFSGVNGVFSTQNFQVVVQKPEYPFEPRILWQAVGTDSFSLDLVLTQGEGASLNVNQSELNYLWEFSDGSSSSEKSFVKTFTDDGSYSVRLNVFYQQELVGTSSRNLSVPINAEAKEIPKFYMSGNKALAPASIELNGRRYLTQNESEIRSFSWLKNLEVVQDGRDVEVIDVDSIGAYEISLLVEFNDGQVVSSETDTLEVVGMREPIQHEVDVVGATPEPSLNDAKVVSIERVPSKVFLDSSRSYSNYDRAIEHKWIVEGVELRGSRVPYTVIDIGTKSIFSVIADSEGNESLQEISLGVTNEKCDEIHNSSYCPSLVGFPNRVVDANASELTFDLNTQVDFLDTAGQVTIGNTEFAMVFEADSTAYWDLSERVQINGSIVEISKQDLLDLGVNLDARLHFEFNLMSESSPSSLLLGRISNVVFAKYSLGISADEPNATYTVDSLDSNFFRSGRAGNGGVDLEGVPDGKLRVQIGNGSSELSTIVEAGTVGSISLIQGELVISAVSLSDGGSQVVNSALIETLEFLPAEPSLVAASQMSQLQASSVDLVDQYRDVNWFNFPVNTSVSGYRLSSTKPNEFIRDGVVDWVPLGSPDISEPHKKYYFEGGNKFVKLLCADRSGYSGRSLHNTAYNRWQYGIYRQNCLRYEEEFDHQTEELRKSALEKCHNTADNLISAANLAYQLVGPEVSNFQITISGSEPNQQKVEDLSFSFNMAAERMNLLGPEAIQHYFGIWGTSGQTSGAWGPYIEYDIKVPDEWRDIKIGGRFPSFMRTGVGIQGGFVSALCWYAAYEDESKPKITELAEVFSLNNDVLASTQLSAIQIENSQRLFDGTGRLPLDWGPPVPFDYTEGGVSLTQAFDPFVPMEIKISNTRMIHPDQIAIEVKRTDASVGVIIEKPDIQVVEEIEELGELIVRFKLDVRELDSLNWNPSIISDSVEFKVSAKWFDYFDGEERDSYSYKRSFEYTINAKNYGTDICTKGFYSFPNPFGKPSFFNSFILQRGNFNGGRCNDVGHPFGGQFGPHVSDGHYEGNAIDLRYPMHAYDDASTMDYMDSGFGNGKKVDGTTILLWAEQLYDKYLSLQNAESSLGTQLAFYCNAGGGALRCIESYEDLVFPEDFGKIIEFCLVNYSSSNSGDTSYIDFCNPLPSPVSPNQVEVPIENILRFNDLVASSRRAVLELQNSIGFNTFVYMDVGLGRERLQYSWFKTALRESELESKVGFSIPLFDVVRTQDAILLGEKIEISDEIRNALKDLNEIKFIGGHQNHTHVRLRRGSN